MESGLPLDSGKAEVTSQMVLEDENTACPLPDYHMGQLKNECRTFSPLASSHPIYVHREQEHSTTSVLNIRTLRTTETVLQPTKLEWI